MRGLLIFICLVSTACALLGGIDQKHASQSLKGSKSSSGSGNSVNMSPSVAKAEETIARSKVIVKVIQCYFFFHDFIGLSI